jgi:uncharacterized protein YndB with AHSA1/START domain
MTVPFTIARTFDAPRSQVWKAYTQIEGLRHWWGPKGFTWLGGTLDFRPGCIFHYGMRAPDGHEMWGKFNYREIVPQEKVVFTNSFSDKDGATTRAPFAADWPLEVLNTVLFTEHNGKTTISMSGAPFNATAAEQARFDAMRESMNQGFTGTFDQLEAYLAAPRGDVTITRLFDAPRELVFRMWTDAKLVQKWWAPEGFTNPVCEWDARVGGAIRIVMHARDDIAAMIGKADHPMKGVFLEVTPPERLVFTNIAVDEEGNTVLDGLTTVTFAEESGKTHMTMHTTVTGLAPIAPQMLQGMEMGWNQSFDKLRDLIAQTR